MDAALRTRTLTTLTLASITSDAMRLPGCECAFPSGGLQGNRRSFDATISLIVCQHQSTPFSRKPLQLRAKRSRGLWCNATIPKHEHLMTLHVARG